MAMAAVSPSLVHASAGPAGRPVAEPFAAFAVDPDSRSVLARYAESRGWPTAAVQAGGVASAARTLWVAPPPEILVVDVSESLAPLEDLKGLEPAFRRNTRVIAFGTENDVTLYHDLVEAGAAGYLVKPLTADEIDRALRLTLRSAGEPAVATGRAIGVVGARGGVGASTVASALAWSASTRFALSSILLDLHLHYGTAALNLDLQVGAGLREALEEPERIDELLLDRALVPVSERLSVLAAEEALDRMTRVEPIAATALLDILKERASLVVADLPRHEPTTMAALAPGLHHLLVVTDLTLAGLRDTTRLLRFLEDGAPASRCILLANHVPGSGGGGRPSGLRA